MTPHLYVLSIGPVQDFIAAARRTRDLWMGSLILSEISKAAAKKITDMGGELIFPALDAGSKDLDPAFQSGGKQQTKSDDLLKAFNVANVIRAEIPENIECSLQEFDREVKTAAQAEWMEYADSTLTIINKNDRGIINKTIWDEQVKDVIEFYSAWVPLGDNYSVAQKRLMRIHTARKATRDFKPASVHWGIEKSSLDGARESVLKKKIHFSKDLTLRLRLTKSEQLCAVGLTKRLGGSKVPFPSVSRIALDPWIRGIEISKNKNAIESLKKIKTLCKNENSFSSGTGNLYQNFPFDGQVCYQERLKGLNDDITALKNDLGNDRALQTDLANLKEIEKQAAKLRELFGEPNPYLAVMVADGDHMGKVISNIDSSQGHRGFSGALADFAKETRNIVENDGKGVLVFAGGEDILAFLPVDTCLNAARKLHDTFGELLEKHPDEEGKCPTLSVGIAIGHFLDPLEDLLEYGREAEKDAKDPDRNGLAVHLHTRNGGDPIKVREQWEPAGKTDEFVSLDGRLDAWGDMYRDKKFPDGAAYDLRQLAGEYAGWKNIPQDLLRKDVERLLKRKRADGGTKGIEEEDIKKLMSGVKKSGDLARRAEELVLARRIDTVKRQARGPVWEEATS